MIRILFFSLQRSVLASAVFLSFFLIATQVAGSSDIPGRLWQGTKSQKAQLYQNLQTSLKSLEDISSGLPVEEGSKLRDKTLALKQKITRQPMAYSVIELLSLLLVSLQNAHQLTVREGMYNGMPAYYIHMGYLASYYLTADRQQGGIWDSTNKKWQPLGRNDLRHVHAAQRMGMKYQRISWLNLPAIPGKLPGELSPPEMLPNLKNDVRKVFPQKTSERIRNKIEAINVFLKDSPLSALLPSQDLLMTDTRLTYSTLHNILSQLSHLLMRSNRLSYAAIEHENSIDMPVHVLFLGAFTAIGEDGFLFMDTDSGKLKPAGSSPGISYQLKSEALYNGQPTKLLPIDPSSGLILKKKKILSENIKAVLLNYKVLIVGIPGIAGIIIIFFYLLRLAISLRRIHLQAAGSADYNANNLLGKFLLACCYENREQWINILYEMLSNEKKQQKMLDSFIKRIAIVINLAGMMFAVISIILAIKQSVIYSVHIPQALVPLVISLIITIFLLLGQMLIMMLHNRLLLKFEKHSWLLLSSKNNTVPMKEALAVSHGNC